MTRAEVVLDGDVGPLRKTLREGISAMNAFSKDSTRELNSATEPLEGMAKKFAGLVGVIGSGAIFKEVIDETVKFTKEVNGLSRVLGVNTAEATAWNVALGDIYQDADALTGAVGKLTKVIAEDEGNLNKLGIATRDANGQLKAQGDIFLSVTGYLGQFTVGTNRNIEMAKIFGKSWADVAPLLNLTQKAIEDAKQKADDLGLTLTEQSQTRVKDYRAAMNDVGDVMLGLKNAIGQAVMPVLTRLGEWFSAIGPNAVLIVRGAVNGLATAFMGLQNAVVIVWEVVNSFVFSVAEPIRSLGEALLHLANGEFKAASEAMMGWPQRIGQQWAGTMDRIAASSKRTADDIAALWGPGNAAKGPSEGAGATTGKPKKDKADASQMEALEAMMAKQKQMLIEGGFIREYEAQQELAFWKSKLEMAELSAADRLKIDRKVAQLSYEIKKKSLEQDRSLTAEERKASDDFAMSKLETELSAAKILLDNKAITKQQFLGIELDYEAQRYAIQAQALQDRLALLALDPNSNPVEAARIKGEQLRLEQEYQRARLAAMSSAGSGGDATGAFGNDVAASFGQSLEGIIGRTKTFMQTMAGLFRGVRDAFVKHMITEPVVQYIAAQAKLLAVKLGFLTSEKAAEAAGAAATVGIKAGETSAVVAGNAIQAGTGAAASQASIPYIGPILALAAMAAIFAAVSSFGGGGGKSSTSTTSTKIPSAANGFDIPAGVNPMTQLHEEEMVLPSKYANAIRAMVDGGGEGGQGGGGQVTYNDHSGRLSQSDIRRNARIIADELTRLGRNGYRPKA